ncbi:MAG: DUF6088 family protein [Prevotellaceae bacterium]|jgi:hypothetical protein|nr:DUF6088 family protein [Prevotellaceae bacterium]
MQSVRNQIRKEIAKRKKGEIIFADELKKFGSAGAVRVTLFRLCKEGFIVRLSPCIYLYPNRNANDRIFYPPINGIIEQIAKHDNTKIVPTGMYALNALGLSDKMSLHFVFLHDGSARTLKIGKVLVVFKKTAPEKLSYESKVCALVIFALKKIGKSNTTAEELTKIYEALSHETDANIIHDASLAPQWISNILMNYLKKRSE